MSESQSTKLDKLSAARRKLKEFQEQKKLREKSNAPQNVKNENNLPSTLAEDLPQQNISPSNENVSQQYHLKGSSNVNTVEYSQQPLSDTGGQQPENNNQGYYNLPSSYPSHVNDSLIPTNPHQNSNVNASVNMQEYVTEHIFQHNHSVEDFNTESSSQYETFNNSQFQTDSSSSQNVNNLTNVNNETRKWSSENNFNQNRDIAFHQYSNNVNISVSPDTNKNNLNSESNSGMPERPESGYGPSSKDTGSSNYNILSVFTDSSTTSSHTSSTHTGPFLLNEEIPPQVKNGNSPQQFSEASNRTSEPPEEISHDNSNTCGANANSYHLFEKTHNENYFGINFGNDQGPGIHMGIHPFEHRNEKMVSDFLDSESKADQYTLQESSLPSDELRTENHEPLHAPINLLNDTFRRNLMSLSTSKSTSIDEYTDKSTRGNSTVSKSVSLESSGGGGVGERGEDLMGKDSTNSSTVFSSCDNLGKLLNSSAAESSSELACERDEELRAVLAAERERNGELRALLTGEQGRASGLEAQVHQLQNEIQTLHSTQSEQCKRYASENEALQQKLKSQTRTIQILIEEKAELEARAKSWAELIEEKSREIEELRGRLAISKHKCGNTERDAALLKEQLELRGQALTQANEALTQERKEAERLADDRAELRHKLEARSQELAQLQARLQERDSQLSLMQLKVQQLSAAGGPIPPESASEAQSLQQECSRLRSAVTELREQMLTERRERDAARQHNAHMINSLKAQMEELSTHYGAACDERSSLQSQCETQIEHISELERAVQSLRRQAQRDPSGDEGALKPLVAEMETKIKALSLEKQRADTALQAQILETELAQARASQLSAELERLEADRPDASALLSAMESDKVAAARAVQQNSDLKRQLQELQDALIRLNNSKLELSEQLSQEQAHTSQLRQALETLQQQQQQQQQQLLAAQQQLAAHGLESERRSEHAMNGGGAAPSSCSPHSTQAQESSVPGDPEALGLLEAKFKAAMTRLAELSDEKQRLEHLVTQLQLETETIGEYAALYQKQRYLLQQKSREKDEQVKQLSQDQEALKQKLARLNGLVQEFVTQGPPSAKEVLLETDVTLRASPVAAPAAQDTRASQIMELISEIEANSLVDGGVPSSFHPCPVCSGQLITV